MRKSMNLTEHRAVLSAQAAVTAAGAFEVLAITAGEGNGWQFGEAALRESLPLWDGAECFVDHALSARSVRDLAGVLRGPQWDAERRGVRCALAPLGPSADVLRELGRQMLETDFSGADRTPRVGFSADLVFAAQGQQVEKILRVLSVDLVYHPARGGAFVRALNSRDLSTQIEGALTMENEQNAALPPAGGTTETTSRAQMFAQAPAPELQADPRQQMCACLLETSLAAARLPQPVSERIRARFSGRTFLPAELTAAVDDARALLADLTGPAVVQGPRSIHGMLSSEDQFTAAVYDLLGAERPDPLKGARTARLSGIRELYTLMTGDVDFAGGYDAERARFATTADLPGVLKNAMNRLIVQEWQELGRSGYRWWEPVVTVEHFNNLQSITGVLVGEVTVLPTVAEGDAYTALDVSDSAETALWTKYGGYIGLTLEMFERDETHKLRQYPRKLAAAGLRRISSLVGQVFTENSGAGPVMADTYNVFEAAHHANLGTGALTSDTWEAASQAIYSQPMVIASGGTAPSLALDAKYLLVPRAMRLAGMRILYPSWEREANIVSENLQRGEMGDVITCPEFSDANDWAAVADPRLAPGIVIAERFGLTPEIIIADGQAHGALFTNDEIRMKARHWLAVFVADHRPLYKANVAA